MVPLEVVGARPRFWWFSFKAEHGIFFTVVHPAYWKGVTLKVCESGLALGWVVGGGPQV